MAVERFMKSCGMGQPEGTNEPLDHIATELEFLQHLALLNAGVVEPPEDVEVSSSAFEDFYSAHFRDFSGKVAHKTIQESQEPFFKAAARILSSLSIK